jgi:hypothetical protein
MGRLSRPSLILFVNSLFRACYLPDPRKKFPVTLCREFDENRQIYAGKLPMHDSNVSDYRKIPCYFPC